MFKKLLMSGLVLGALAALVGGASYATFTDTATGTGSVTAGTLNIEAGTVSTTGPNTTCENLAPGDTCTAEIQVGNSGSLALDYTATATVGGNLSTCDGGGRFTVGTVQYLAVTGSWQQHMAPGGQEKVRVIATLSSDAGNDCQGDSGTITINIVAIQAANPHSPLD